MWRPVKESLLCATLVRTLRPKVEKNAGERAEKRASISVKLGCLQFVQDGDLKMERAAEKAKMTVEEFKKVMENTSNRELWSKHYIEHDSSKMSFDDAHKFINI